MKRAILYTLASIVLVSSAFPLSAGACYRMEALQQVLDNYAGACELEHTYEYHNGGLLVYARVWEVCNNARESWVSYVRTEGPVYMGDCDNNRKYTCNGTLGTSLVCNENVHRVNNTENFVETINTYCDGSTESIWTWDSKYPWPPAYAEESECFVGSGTVSNACDDYSKTLYTTVLIKDCKDLDGDGHYKEGDYYCPCGDDCDDNNGKVYIKEVEEEICSSDKKDNDCDGVIDERSGCGECGPLGTGMESSANTISGRYTHSQHLLGDLSLYYDSFSVYSGTVAQNWRHGYEFDFRETSDGRVAFSTAAGSARTYTPSGGSYTSESGDTSTLVKNGDGTWDITELDGTVYHFDVFGNISSISDTRGRTTTFSYYSGLLTSVADSTAPAPVFIDYVDGKIDTVTDPSGNIYDFNYYPDGTLEEIIYPLPASYPLDVPQPDGTTASVSYPEAGAVNPKWSYTYVNGLLKTKTDPSGKLVTYNFVDGKITSSTVTTEYGVRTRTLGYSNYTGDMRETLKTELDGGVWKYRYSKTEGKLKEKEDPEGGVTFYTYGSYFKTEIQAGGKKKTTTRYDGNRNVIKSIEEELVSPFRKYSTTYSYNTFGLISTTTTPLEGAFDDVGNPVNAVSTVYRYDDKGQPIYMGDSLGRETFIQYTTIGTEKHVTTTGPLGRVSTVIYDEQDRLLSATSPSSVTGVNATTSYTYGVLGNMSTLTDTMGRVTRYKYDSLGRMVQLIGPNEERTTYLYNTDGSIESVIDGEGNKTSYTYTNLGRQKAIIDALNKATFMSYSAAGCGNCGGGVDKLTQVTDANGKSTTYTYDKLGRLLTETDATGLQKSFDYNPNRYEYTKTDARGIAITYVNDYIGRLTEKKVEGVTKETYSYYINGRLHRASKDGLTYTYTYYADGQVRDVTDSKGKKLSYKYDALGIRTEVNINDGMGLNRTITYTYTDANQLDTITAEPGVFDYDYRLDGSREKLTYPNTVFTNYSYDASGRMVGVITPGVSSTVYSYDKVGNRLSKATDGKKISYIYDDLYRLRFASHTSTEGAMFENYTYDAIGNRQAHDNDLINNYYPGFDPDFTNSTTVGGFTYYDVAGKGYQTTFTDVADSVDYGYDYEERLVRVKRVFGISSTVVEYEYDVFGRRIGRTVTVDGSVTVNMEYLYDNEDIVAVYENSTTLVKQFIHGPGIDEPLAVKTGGSWYYYHADGLGSVMKLTNASGTSEAGYSFGYDSFGNLVKGSLDRLYTYTGREWDEEAGLYYYRARFYDAEVGRFISKDPIGFEGGDYNVYSYVQQNPVNWIDPWGLIGYKPGGPIQFTPGGGSSLIPPYTVVPTGGGGGLSPSGGAATVGGAAAGAAAMSGGGKAKEPAPYDKYEENEALNFKPDPFGGDEACRRLLHAINVLRSQIAWRKIDLNPASDSYGGHVRRIAILTAAKEKLEETYRIICGRCPS